MYWKLNRLQFPVYNLGPGRRLALWVQGCSLRCTGCVNPELWPAAGGRKINLEQLAVAILDVSASYDGITITGGEPFDQYEPLIAFCSFLKQKKDINILVFSGYTINQLIEKFPDKLFLNCINHLIDGPYLHQLNVKKTLRGSSNQNFYTFESGKINPSGAVAENSKWSINIDEDNRVFMAGIPGKDDLQNLRASLSKTGINLDF